MIGLICALSFALLSADGISFGQVAQHTTGKISKDIYASPDGDFRVVIPNANVPGASARDEGSTEGWQVIFTDDLGGFYRLISMKNSNGELNVDVVLLMPTYEKAFDKEDIKTLRGREIRFIDVEKNGSEMTITTSKKQPDGSTKIESTRPDLVTANAVFEASGRLYHLIAGVTMTDLDLPDGVFDSKPPIAVVPMSKDKMDQASAVKKAKERLKRLLEGFQLGDPKR